MSENPRRGRQARNFTTNVPKILVLKSSSEQIFSRKLPLGAPDSTLVTQLTEVSQLPQKTTISSSETKGTVLLQTVSAIARNEDGSKSTGVEILFDSGSGGSLSIVDQRILLLLRIIFRLNFDEVWVFFI